jgi:uncharacterized protein YgiB involved in biofilm formation
MKRSKSISLALVSTIPFALTACSDSNEEVRTVSSSKTFENIQQCVDIKVPVDVCSNSYMMALNEHKKIAPTYASQDDCEGDFVKDYCVVNDAGKWMPKLGGFQITESHAVKYRKDESGNFAPVAAPVQAATAGTTTTTGAGGGTTIINNTTGGGGGGGADFLTGMLIGNAMGGGGGRTTNNYYSEPVYKTRDSRGDYKTSTINERVESGSTFKASEQTKSGFDYKQKSMTGSLSGRSQPTNSSYNNSGYKTSSSNYTSSSRSAESASISRGGFGSQAVARSSWGGGGSSSFGG